MRREGKQDKDACAQREQTREAQSPGWQIPNTSGDACRVPRGVALLLFANYFFLAAFLTAFFAAGFFAAAFLVAMVAILPSLQRIRCS